MALVKSPCHNLSSDHASTMGNSESGCGGVRMCEGDAVATTTAPTTGADGVSALASIFVLGGTGSSEGMSQLMSVERFGKSSCIVHPSSMCTHWRVKSRMRCGHPRTTPLGSICRALPSQIHAPSDTQTWVHWDEPHSRPIPTDAQTV